MSLFSGMNISASGLSAQRVRIETVTENIANVDTTRTEDGTPYTRKYVVLEERDDSFANVLDRGLNERLNWGIHRNRSLNEDMHYELDWGLRRGLPGGLTRDASEGDGVRVAVVGEDPAEYKMSYEPTHPDADENGYVRRPNVDMAQEMVDLMSAYRSYEANVTAFQAYKDMIVKTLEIGG